MRDLVFKNLTSNRRKRRILSTSEVIEQNGVLTKVKRNFIYIVKNVQEAKNNTLLPRLYVLKHKDSRRDKEKFFCRIKGSLYTVNKDKLFFVIFSHSLTINLMPVAVKK